MRLCCGRLGARLRRMQPIDRILLCHTQSLKRIKGLSFFRRLATNRRHALFGLRHLRL